MGKDIPTQTYVTESGGMTGEILVDILVYLDFLSVYNCSNNMAPALTVDGHITCFTLAFVNYVNNRRHTWKALLRISYTASFWQVGDSSKQNGLFKTLWY